MTVNHGPALHAGLEDVNQHTIEVRNGQAILAGPMVSPSVPLLLKLGSCAMIC